MRMKQKRSNWHNARQLPVAADVVLTYYLPVSVSKRYAQCAVVPKSITLQRTEKKAV
jgi:hypothetical protein